MGWEGCGGKSVLRGDAVGAAGGGVGGAGERGGRRQKRRQWDLNPCGLSPLDFESISITARPHCLLSKWRAPLSSGVMGWVWVAVCKERRHLNPFTWHFLVLECVALWVWVCLCV